MKKYLILISVVLITLSCSAKQISMSEAPSKELNTKKVDLRLRSAYERAKKEGNWSKEFKCLAKLNQNATSNALKKLKKNGFKVGIKARTIVTGIVTAGKLPQVVDLSEVKYLELAVPLSQKKKKQ